MPRRPASAPDRKRRASRAAFPCDPCLAWDGRRRGRARAERADIERPRPVRQGGGPQPVARGPLRLERQGTAAPLQGSRARGIEVAAVATTPRAPKTLPPAFWDSLLGLLCKLDDQPGRHLGPSGHRGHFTSGGDDNQGHAVGQRGECRTRSAVTETLGSPPASGRQAASVGMTSCGRSSQTVG